jgi:PKD repeat protein
MAFVEEYDDGVVVWEENATNDHRWNAGGLGLVSVPIEIDPYANNQSRHQDSYFGEAYGGHIVVFDTVVWGKYGYTGRTALSYHFRRDTFHPITDDIYLVGLYGRVIHIHTDWTLIDPLPEGIFIVDQGGQARPPLFPLPPTGGWDGSYMCGGGTSVLIHVYHNYTLKGCIDFVSKDTLRYEMTVETTDGVPIPFLYVEMDIRDTWSSESRRYWELVNPGLDGSYYPPRFESGVYRFMTDENGRASLDIAMPSYAVDFDFVYRVPDAGIKWSSHLGYIGLNHSIRGRLLGNVVQEIFDPAVFVNANVIGNITISTDTTWSDALYQVGNLRIADGATLTVRNSTLLMHSNRSEVIGLSEVQVFFTDIEVEAGGRLEVYNTTIVPRERNAVVQFDCAGSFSFVDSVLDRFGTFEMVDSAALVVNTRFLRAGDDGIRMERSQVDIRDSTFEDINGHSLYLRDGSSARLTNVSCAYNYRLHLKTWMYPRGGEPWHLPAIKVESSQVAIECLTVGTRAMPPELTVFSEGSISNSTIDYTFESVRVDRSDIVLTNTDTTISIGDGSSVWLVNVSRLAEYWDRDATDSILYRRWWLDALIVNETIPVPEAEFKVTDADGLLIRHTHSGTDGRVPTTTLTQYVNTSSTHEDRCDYTLGARKNTRAWTELEVEMDRSRYVVIEIVDNLCPLVEPVPDQHLLGTKAYEYQIEATDPDSNYPLVYLDDTSLFDIGASTGLISFTPSNDDAGTHTVSITVEDDLGGSTSIAVVFFIEEYLNTPPVADAGPDQTVYLGTTVVLDGSGSHDVDGPIAGYSWDFGDGTPVGSGVEVTHDYSDHGVYTVTLTVTDDFGEMDTDTCTVTVLDNPPVADAGDDMTLLVDETGAFDGSGSYDVDGAIVSYSWDFGDGSAAASGVTATHPYAVAGTYTVTLTVTDDDGSTGTDTLTVTVLTPSEATEDLIDVVDDLDLPEGTNTSLVSKLEGAIAALEGSQYNAAINKIEAFINEVEAQRGKALTDEEADTLIALAEWIIANI